MSHYYLNQFSVFQLLAGAGEAINNKTSKRILYIYFDTCFTAQDRLTEAFFRYKVSTHIWLYSYHESTWPKLPLIHTKLVDIDISIILDWIQWWSPQMMSSIHLCNNTRTYSHLISPHWLASLGSMTGKRTVFFQNSRFLKSFFQ